MSNKYFEGYDKEKALKNRYRQPQSAAEADAAEAKWLYDQTKWLIDTINMSEGRYSSCFNHEELEHLVYDKIKWHPEIATMQIADGRNIAMECAKNSKMHGVLLWIVKNFPEVCRQQDFYGDSVGLRYAVAFQKALYSEDGYIDAGTIYTAKEILKEIMKDDKAKNLQNCDGETMQQKFNEGLYILEQYGSEGAELAEHFGKWFKKLNEDQSGRQ